MVKSSKTIRHRLNFFSYACHEPQEAQLSLTNRAMLVCKVIEVRQDFLSEYVDKKFTYICYRWLIRHEWIYYGSKNCVIYNSYKIAVFTYHSPHFCFPWRRPCDYHAICCMNEKTIDNTVLAKRLAACTHLLSATVSQLFEPQVQKIAVFTYRSTHFCFPWSHPCDYHTVCCMDGKTIQCLPNPSQHVPIYLQ